MAIVETPWIELRRPLPNAVIRLFCFPYAGGSASLYRDWQRRLPQGVDVCPVQLPGRGRRFGEALLKSMPELVEAAAAALMPYFEAPFAFFGYSMGALLGFELARLLQAKHGITPLLLMVAGAKAPHLQVYERPTYELPDAEFMQELRTINGTSPELLEDEEVMRLLLPLLRADFRVVQTYRYEPGPKVACPITAFGGLQDDHVGPAYIKAWREHTSAGFSCSMLPGDHFFIDRSPADLLRQVNLALSSVLRALSSEAP